MCENVRSTEKCIMYAWCTRKNPVNRTARVFFKTKKTSNSSDRLKRRNRTKRDGEREKKQPPQSHYICIYVNRMRAWVTVRKFSILPKLLSIQSAQNDALFKMSHYYQHIYLIPIGLPANYRHRHRTKHIINYTLLNFNHNILYRFDDDKWRRIKTPESNQTRRLRPMRLWENFFLSIVVDDA